jgi:pyruvate decarboxylase
LSELAKRVKKNTTAYENYKRIFVPEGQLLQCERNEPLRANVLFKHIQKTGDSWFDYQKLKLPEGCG